MAMMSPPPWNIVHFRSLERPKEDDFVLELSKLHNYDEVVERVTQQVGLDDPSKIRLTSHSCYSQQPKPQPIKFRGVERLSDMLVHYNQTSDILYYEVLDIPLPELQGLKKLKVAFHHASKDEVDLSRPDAELRLLEVFYHKIYKIFPSSEKIENINDQYWTLRAEEIPEEEKDLGPHDRLIHVYHFMKETAQNQLQVQNFGEPFLLVIHDGETLAEVKMRIQKKLQVPDDAFSKWKFAFLSLGRPEYLEDSVILSNRFQRRDVYGEQYLGLEHSDASKRTYVVNQVTLPDTFTTCFSNLEEIINVSESSPARGGSNTSSQKCALSTSETPTLEEVEKAKLSLKECLSDLFKLNVKDRLAEAVSTLSIAKSGLSQDQQKSVKAFWANFDEFTSDFLTFERDNVEFELQKLLKDQMFVTVKRKYETHILYKQLLGGLTEEEEELNKKLEEVKSRREKLISDWEILVVESEEAKSGYQGQEKKAAEAEEKKRIAEERMSRSTTAWSNLKSLFG